MLASSGPHGGFTVIPLRYVPVPAALLACPEKMGNPMLLERAMAVMMLDPVTVYQAIDIARFIHRYDPGLDRQARGRLVANTRRSFSELAKLGRDSTNPDLNGAEWVKLLRGNIHAVAAKMEELRVLTHDHPGVLFTLVDDQLVPHPDQSLDPIFRTPPKRKHHYPKRSQKRLAVEEPKAAPEPLVEVPASPLAEPAPAKVLTRPNRRLLGPIALLALLLPSAFGVYYLNLPRFGLADIQEMGAPYDEDPQLVAKGKRFHVGDRVIFEGSMGVIQLITREEIQVGSEHHDAPTLLFFGYEMNVEGNYVVFPGSPRLIAGNFWLSTTDVLDSAEPGYLSWIGGLSHYFGCTGRLSDIMGFWGKVSGRTVKTVGEQDVIVMESTQLEPFLHNLTEKGFMVNDQKDVLEVKWEAH